MLYSQILQLIAGAACMLGLTAATFTPVAQTPILQHSDGRNVSTALFLELEELARLADITYCISTGSYGIAKPFSCLSRCSDFPAFELVKTWNTGIMLSDSCGYIALDHYKQRIIVAFRGSYSISNAIVDLSTVPQEYTPYPGSNNDDNDEPKCHNCSVHTGFHTAWLNTRKTIIADLSAQIETYPTYQLNLIGHSLGGSIAALAGLDFIARGWDPLVTTYGEPRAGNKGLVQYVDSRFNLNNQTDHESLRYRRVTHINDPVPLLPLSEWGYAMHAGEIFIIKPSLSPDLSDVRYCVGDFDPECIAGQDSSVSVLGTMDGKRDLLSSLVDEAYELHTEPWGIPSRYRLWEMLTAHRDYFWRLGVCAPGGNLVGGGEGYEHMRPGDGDELR